MKTILIVLFLSLICVSELFSYLVSPPGASHRLNRWIGTPMEIMGSWQEISYHNDLDGNPTWGQSQCYGTGSECHLYDCYTWWFPMRISEPGAPPNPQGEGYYTTEYPPFPPTGYNPNTGQYSY